MAVLDERRWTPAVAGVAVGAAVTGVVGRARLTRHPRSVLSGGCGRGGGEIAGVAVGETVGVAAGIGFAAETLNRHSGLDPESSVFKEPSRNRPKTLDSRLKTCGNDGLRPCGRDGGETVGVTAGQLPPEQRSAAQQHGPGPRPVFPMASGCPGRRYKNKQRPSKNGAV